MKLKIMFFGMIVLQPLIGCASLPSAKVTLNVVDQSTGLSLSNATAKTTFLLKSSWNDPDKYQEVEEITDDFGKCTLTGNDLDHYFNVRIFSEGYYESQFRVEATKVNRILNRWEPWNPTIEVKMRPKKNPVPMIQKRIESLKIPAWDQPLGFDLELGDWIDPHGKGKQADFFVNMYRRFEHSSDYDAVATITFPNAGDGILLYTTPEEFQGSSYQFPYEAPMEGYQDTLVLERHATLHATDCSFNPDTDLYIFRVRTKKDNEGKIVSACYGRIDRRIEIGWGEVFDFEYHFNPVANERSLEWNGENLLQQ